MGNFVCRKNSLGPDFVRRRSITKFKGGFPQREKEKTHAHKRGDHLDPG